MKSPRIPHTDRAVARWLLILCALVFVMIVLGGFTRLTGSGLSMVDWRPVVGWLPPLTDAAWEESFAAYRQSPEYQQVNAGMDVAGYKKIFWLEYLHRLLGRIIGLVFIIPFVWFAARGAIAKKDWPKYLLMFVLGGMQGALGWYMVKSGLVNDPHVSQYRLTAHLLAAIAIYTYMFWIALSLLYPKTGPRHPWFGRTLALCGAILLTIVSGGFVAGLKAGHIYNTFPKMGDNWIAPGLLALDPAWRNFTENPATAQFDHRLLAITTLILIVIYFIRARHQDFSTRSYKATKAVMHSAFLQVAIGITTLLMSVPIFLGGLHQAIAIVLFTAALFLLHSLRSTETASDLG